MRSGKSRNKTPPSAIPDSGFRGLTGCQNAVSVVRSDKIYISNNGSTIAGTEAAPAGSYFGYPVHPGKYQVRVPAGNRDVTILDLGGKAHSVVVKAC